MKKRVFSGIRASGRLHLGNFLGAVKGMLALQENYDCIFSVVDLHTITTPYNPKTLSDNIQEVILDYLAAGIDPQKCHLMIQSKVRGHIELSYFFSTIYPVSRLEQLPTYKDKKLQFPQYINLGLLYYPVLMAADILLYKAELVPVGIDQEPHLEVTREIARKFNRMFGQTFPEPKRFKTKGEHIPSLTGKGKMSKTIKGSYILLTDDLKTIKKRLAKTPTDIGYGKKIPEEGGVVNLLKLVEIFEGKRERKIYEAQYLGKGIKYAQLKERLALAIYSQLKSFQQRRKFFQKNQDKVKKILDEGKKYCQKIAKKTLKEVKLKMWALP